MDSRANDFLDYGDQQYVYDDTLDESYEQELFPPQVSYPSLDNYNEAYYIANQDEIVELPCEFCKRTFRPNTLDRHRTICYGSWLKTRERQNKQEMKLRDMCTSAMSQGQNRGRLDMVEDQKLAELEKLRHRRKERRMQWRQRHEDFISAVRAARTYVIAKQNGDVLPPPPPPSINPDLMLCAICQRRFNSKSYEKHVVRCKEQVVQQSRQTVSRSQMDAKKRLATRLLYNPGQSRAGTSMDNYMYTPSSTRPVSRAESCMPLGLSSPQRRPGGVPTYPMVTTLSRPTSSTSNLLSGVSQKLIQQQIQKKSIVQSCPASTASTRVQMLKQQQCPGSPRSNASSRGASPIPQPLRLSRQTPQPSSPQSSRLVSQQNSPQLVKSPLSTTTKSANHQQMSPQKSHKVVQQKQSTTQQKIAPQTEQGQTVPQKQSTTQQKTASPSEQVPQKPQTQLLKSDQQQSRPTTQQLVRSEIQPQRPSTTGDSSTPQSSPDLDLHQPPVVKSTATVNLVRSTAVLEPSIETPSLLSIGSNQSDKSDKAEARLKGDTISTSQHQVIKKTTKSSCQDMEPAPKFCHECGSKFAKSQAKFCCQCGTKRLCI